MAKRHIFVRRPTWNAQLLFDTKARTFHYSVVLYDPDELCVLPFDQIVVLEGHEKDYTQDVRNRARAFARRLADTLTWDVCR